MIKHLFIASLAGIAAFSGCTTVNKCEFGDMVATRAVMGIAKSLDCYGVDAMRVDVRVWINPKTLCNRDKDVVAEGFMATLICPKVVDGMVQAGLTNVPPRWDCKGGFVADQAHEALLQGCTKALDGY